MSPSQNDSADSDETEVEVELEEGEWKAMTVEELLVELGADQECVSKKVRVLKAEGMGQSQAVAAAINYCSEKAKD